MSNTKITHLLSKAALAGLLLLALLLAACNTMTDSAAAASTDFVTESSVPVAVVNDEAPAAAEAPAQEAPVVIAADSHINASTSAASDTTTPPLSEDEIADLLFMREEEKMARDLYLALYDLWGTPVYHNIAASEQAHMDAVLSLISRYGLPDPAADNGAGVFVDPALQSLYDQLLAAGSQSAVDALYVGAAVEEVDILDLQGSLAQTNKDDISAVYHQLLAGSENHLRAFVSSWERQTGSTYEPQSLSANEYTEIMGGTPAGTGNGQGQSGYGQGSNGQGGNGQGGNGQGYRGGRGGDGTVENGAGGPGGRGVQ